MKKILIPVIGLVLLSGCATAPVQQACTDAFVRPSYFDQGEELAGFAFSAGARGYGLDGILQIKRRDMASYEAVAFTLDGYQLFQAVISPEAVEYPFLSKAVNRASVRSKLTRFLKMLLVPPATLRDCRVKKEIRYVHYQNPGQVTYFYPAQQHYPTQAQMSKMFGSARLEYGEYQKYGEGLLPQVMFYQDSAAYIDLRLLTLKK